MQYHSYAIEGLGAQYAVLLQSIGDVASQTTCRELLDALIAIGWAMEIFSDTCHDYEEGGYDSQTSGLVMMLKP
jgi:hypothetical protein